MNCSNCGSELFAGTKFCPVCGKEADVFCYKCGTPLSVGAQFCKSCGTKINIPERNISGKRKSKEERVSKIYSFIMLGIAALVAMFTPAVQQSGEYYNMQYNTDVFKDAGDIGLLVEKASGSARIVIASETQVILAVVCVGLLLVSVGLHFVNRWWPPLIPAGVFGVLLVVSDGVVCYSARESASYSSIESITHLGVGFFVHLLCIALLIVSFFLNRYRTRERQKVPTGSIYKTSRLETGAFLVFACFFLFATIVTIACYAGGGGAEIFVDTPVPEYRNERALVEDKAKQLCEIYDIDLTGYDLNDVMNDGNGRYIAVFSDNFTTGFYSTTVAYAVYIDSPDYYTGDYLYYTTEPVRKDYDIYDAVDRATPSDWGEENKLYEEILNSHKSLQKGSVVPDISYYQYD